MVGLDAETRQMVLETIHEYGKKYLTHERLIEFDKRNEFPREIMKDLYDPDKVGVNMVMIPQKYGGLGGNSYDIYRACEALSSYDLGVCTAVFASFLGMDPIIVGGTEEQRSKWINKIAQMRCLVAYGATEPSAGSDLLHLKTRAERVMEGDKIVGYKLNGTKMWITNGGYAEICTVLARAPKGVSWFIVEKGTKGFTCDKHEDKHGIRLSDTNPLSLRDVFVPFENLVGGVEGKGLRQAQAVFGYTRLLVAGMALGVGWKAVEYATRYGQLRMVGGHPLSTKQGFMHKLIVPFAARLEAARAFLEEVAAAIDGGAEGMQTEGAIAKLLASETANAACDNAIQAYGGNGYVREFPVEKLKRDIKITCIYEGTSEILELTTFRQRWQDNLNADGRFYDKIAESLDALHAKGPDVGADAAALACRALSRILQACYDQKLTNHQIAHMKLGELMTYSETAAAFCRAAAKDAHAEAARVDQEGWRAMSRIHARHTASWVASEGLALVAGASDVDPVGLVDGINLKAIAKAQKGQVADMDLVSRKLVETFKEEPLAPVKA
ncbi:MAG: acyl-CoA dehydrogenase family protein [Elusimicrobia bacterium]|nr:acyl-CoA dehydrogenase family protein [Elusimicrobiota bacterium]